VTGPDDVVVDASSPVLVPPESPAFLVVHPATRATVARHTAVLRNVMFMGRLQIL
jgi:hypothetical protein